MRMAWFKWEETKTLIFISQREQTNKTAYSYGRETARHMLQHSNLMSAFFEEGGSLWVQISDGRGHRPPTTDGVRKLERLPFSVVSKYSQCIDWFCHKARV